MGAPTASRGETREILVFTLGRERYGLEILQVQEIRSYEAPTPVPKAPAFLLGVKALRGDMVPFVDLRVRFDTQERASSPVVVVVRIAGRLVGLVVDGVSDVLRISAADVRPIPAMGGVVDTRFLGGMVNLDDGLVTLINLVELLSSNELNLLQEAATQEAAA